MATDYSIAAQVKPPSAPDPLTLIGTLQNVQKGGLQNKLLGQQIEGKVALGHAITQATDPETGRTDWDKASSLLAQDPKGSFQMPEFSAAAQTRRLQDMKLSQEQVATTLTKLKPAADLSLSLIAGADKTPLTRENIIGAMKTNLVDTGLFTDDHDLGQLANIAGQLTDDPAKNQLVLQRLFYQLNPTVEALNAMKGAPQMVDTGPAVLPTRVSPATGQVSTSTPIQKGLSPGEAVAPSYEYIDDQGVHHMVTKGAQAAAGASARPQGIPVTPPAGQVEATVAQRQASQQQFSTDVNDAGGFSQRMQGLNNAERALKSAQTGKGGQALQDWRSLLNTVGVPLSDADKAKAVNFDEAKKYLTDYANRRGAALGMGTDASRELIHAANPSVDINKAAAQDILKVIRGLERMQNAQVAAAQAAGVTPGDYATWRAGWNRQVDPAGFMADQVSVKERAAQFDKMTKAQQARYAKGVKAAVDAGYFTLDDLRK